MQTAEQFREFAGLNKNSRRHRRMMDELFPGGWEEEDLADQLCLRKTGKHLLEIDIPSVEVHPPEELSAPKVSSSSGNIAQGANPAIQKVTSPDLDLGHDVEARYRRYLEQFQPEAPNDELMLRLLCENEITLQRLNDRRLRLLETNARPVDLKSIVEAITKLSSECRQIQTHLGIDRPSRGTGQDAGDKLMTYIKNAKTVLRRQSVPLFCTNCYRSESQTLNLYGFQVWHLQDEAVNWRLEFECPRCHTKMVYSKENVADLKALAGWV